MNFIFESGEQTSEILNLPREHKIHMFSSPCNVLLLYRHTDDGVFDDFPKFSEDSTTLVRSSHERCQTLSENY